MPRLVGMRRSRRKRRACHCRGSRCPVVVASRGPLPRLRCAGSVAVVHALHLGGVLHATILARFRAFISSRMLAARTTRRMFARSHPQPSALPMLVSGDAMLLESIHPARLYRSFSASWSDGRPFFPKARRMRACHQGWTQRIRRRHHHIEHHITGNHDAFE